MKSPRIPLVDLGAQYESIRSEVDAAMAAVVRAGQFILGPEVESFEREFGTFCEVPHCIACGNGTDALSLALQAVGVRPGDEVITVAHTFFATAEAIGAIGARPVFADIASDTLLLDPGRLEALLTPKTRAIVPVHLYGQTADMDPILEFARRHRLKVVEDSAQAHGARYKGRRAGSMGDAGTFSFYPGKNLGAYGDAGAIVTHDAAIAEWLRKARDHGRSSKYEHDFEGRNSRMDAIQGAVLRTKLRRLESWNSTRRRLAAAYQRCFNGASAVRVVETSPNCEPVFHLFVVRLRERDAVARHLRDAGIDCGVHYPVPLHLQPAYVALGIPRGSLPNTEKAAEEVLSLPMYPELPSRAVETIAAELIART